MIYIYFTTDMLTQLGACEEQVNDFENLWPDGVDLTLAILHEAYNADLDVYWFAAAALSPINYDTFCSTSSKRWARYHDHAPYNKSTTTPTENTLSIESLRRADFHSIAALLNIPDA